jgi:hypothetical protein
LASSIRKFATNFADKWLSLGRYTSLAGSDWKGVSKIKHKSITEKQNFVMGKKHDKMQPGQQIQRRSLNK